ncbi:ABC transporter substrate-binding protein [Cyanobium sp. FGCU-6]|nr:ABC transporter substrate-binding protein [Cyanobium sp. FGCU6]
MLRGLGWRIGPLALLFALPLAGCRQGPAPLTGEQGGAQGNDVHGAIVLAVGINNDDTIDAALLEDLNQRVGDLIRSYRTLHPRVHVELQPFPEDRLAGELKRRSRDGLAPDLVMVNGTTARSLSQQGLTRPIRIPDAVADELDPGALARVRQPDGRLIGLPLLLQPQLACYDRRRVKEPPTTLEELLARNGGRMQAGLPIDPINLAWTLGPLGTLDTVKRLADGQPATASDRARMRAWLDWLANAHLQQGIHFLTDQDALVKGLANGRLDWISCRSTQLGRLQLRLGPHLGVTVLPSGPGGPASPITRERLLAFGINSTPTQRRAAESLASFSINPLVQRTITLRDLTSLPVNRKLHLPTGSSRTLETLEAARAQGAVNEAATMPLLHVDAEGTERFRRLISGFLYGEIDAETTSGRLVRALSAQSAP